MSLKIHGAPTSTCTGRVLVTCFEKNVEDLVIETVDVATGAQKKPEFLKLQPFGQIPVLQDGDFTIFESRAIARYIADKYESQGTPLFGKGCKNKALVNQWLEVESHNFNPTLFNLFCSLQGLTTDEKLAKVQLEKLDKVLDVYEGHLAKNKYLAGDFFSLADLSHMSNANHLISIVKKGQGITSRKYLKSWWEDISSRTSWKVLKLCAAPQK